VTGESKKLKGSRVRKSLPWLLALCLFGFAGLASIVVYEAATDTSLFPTPTPTSTPSPTFLSGAEIKLVAPAFGPVTFWQLGDGCQPDTVLGQVPSGEDARTLEDACYNHEHGSYYYTVRTAHEARGWVEASVIILSNEYTPPTPTSTATPVPTVRPPRTPTPVVNPTSKPVVPSRSQPQTCCKICTTGKACGDSCISRDKVCHQPPGCACNRP